MTHENSIYISILLFYNKCKCAISCRCRKDTIQCSFFGGLTIGGNPTATGGTPPYSYEWHPQQYLINANNSNPIISQQAVDDTITEYYLKVTDVSGNIAYDTIHAVPFLMVCILSECIIQKNTTDTVSTLGWQCTTHRSLASYRWSPSQYLSDSTVLNPKCWAPVNIYYSLIVTDIYGCEYSLGGCGISINSTNVNEVDNIDGNIVHIYPNPTNETSVLQVTSGFKADYYIATVDGRVVQKGKLVNDKTIIELSKWCSGVYFVSVVKDGRVMFREKLIKN